MPGFVPAHVGNLQSPGATGLDHGRNVPRHWEEAGSGPCKGRETLTGSLSKSLGINHGLASVLSGPRR